MPVRQPSRFPTKLISLPARPMPDLLSVPDRTEFKALALGELQFGTFDPQALP